MVGAELHKTLYIITRTVDSHVLKGLTYAVEQHNGYGFRIFANDKRANRCYAHQHELAEHVALSGMLPRFFHYSKPYRQESYDIPNKPYRLRSEPLNPCGRHYNACKEHCQ